MKPLRQLILLVYSSCLILSPAMTFESSILSSELFILPLKHQNFSFTSSDVIYRPSLFNLPDLPSWLHYSFSPAMRTGYVYGVPPEDVSNIELEVVARSKHTYETSHQVYRMDVEHQSRKPYEVRFKVTNMNVDEILVQSRWEKLMEVMANLWNKTTDQLTVTSLTSAIHKGDRMPARPDQKEGLYISYGSIYNFSSSLYELEREVSVLWHHRPCPVYFKKTSYERFFRHKGFAVDWCSFTMHDNNEEMKLHHMAGLNSAAKSPVISALEKEGRVHLQSREQVEKRSYTFDVVHTILIPLVVMLVLLALLTLAMCCHRNNMDQQSSDFFDELFDDFPRMPKAQDIQMVQYASFNRATDALRMLNKVHEHSPHPSTGTTTTQADTLPRSRTASPSSTLPRNSTLGSRRFEDYATLSRPDPPPYQRNGTTPTR